MLTDEYLYGVEAEVPEVPSEVIVRRVELLKENLEELLDQSYHTRDGKRCNDIIKAISFWENINKGNK